MKGFLFVCFNVTSHIEQFKSQITTQRLMRQEAARFLPGDSRIN